ncbi:hypothetical protein RhiirC2_793395 [Rhizophagus irregularis]|uniref:SH3 domain-containing protein n=1 Tax=Rhizophagus irregularis TaxID=588596 RepID=A0A2N1MFF8_9GLOM|nr:hypothetical protein RhiirC2_793395 [Rhizophagus irregularis]
MKKFIVLSLFLINVPSVLSDPTLCNNIVHSVSSVAFGNYLSFSSGILLTFFNNPSKNDTSLFAKLKRSLVQTAVSQLMAVLALMTFMTIKFFILNSIELPRFLNLCSLVMYGLCGATTLTQCIPSKFKSVRNTIRAGLFVPIYIDQMIFQIYMKLKFSPPGYMGVFQWISILSMLLALPLLFLIRKQDYANEKTIYAFVYPFVIQIYLHVGYLCFYLYCDEGYLSSTLLLFSGFALGNVIHSAYYLVFPRWRYEVPDKGDYTYNPPTNNDYLYRAIALSDYDAQDENELSFYEGESLEVGYIESMWWPARNSRNEVAANHSERWLPYDISTGPRRCST